MKNKITIKNGIKYALFNLKWRCNNCQEENFDNDFFCKNCLEKLPFIKGNKCSHCGRVLLYAQNYCESCIEKNLNFDKALSVFSYEEPINNLIMQLKYNSKLYLAEVFSNYLSNLFFSNFYDSDVITYVPMTKSSLKERGYNQSKVLADKLSEIVNVSVIETAIKVKETSRQATLNLEERTTNLKGAFKVIKENVKDKNILLIDDVLTTGATTNTLAGLYKRAGAKNVYVLTVASVSKIKIKAKNSD